MLEYRVCVRVCVVLYVPRCVCACVSQVPVCTLCHVCVHFYHSMRQLSRIWADSICSPIIHFLYTYWQVFAAVAGVSCIASRIISEPQGHTPKYVCSYVYTL